MEGPESRNLNPDFHAWKAGEGIQADPGGALEGLWSEAHERDVAAFESAYPGISAEFDTLIGLLPEADSPEKDEFPFAAAVVRVSADGKLEAVARAANRVHAHGDSTQHAELAVLQDAQRKIGSRHLSGHMLLSTAQPCEMCAGAVRNTEIGTVVYGITQEELAGMHVEFRDGYKPMRTVPPGVDTDAMLRSQGVAIVAGYKRDEVLKKMRRSVGTTKEYYQDPDA